jgi:predicted nicotinamide N-methyase
VPILELGSGAGLGGISAARCFPSNPVILSDYHQGVLEVLQENVDFNNSQATVEKLDWREYLHGNPQSLPIPSHSIILAADVVYDKSAVTSLSAVLQRLEPKYVHFVLPLRHRFESEIACFEEFISPIWCPLLHEWIYKDTLYRVYSSHDLRGLDQFCDDSRQVH